MGTKRIAAERPRRFSPLADNDLEQLAGAFATLADKTRIRILMLLADGEQTVTGIGHTFQQPQPTISHHLGLLVARNFASARRDGNQKFYSLGNRARACNGLPVIELDRFTIAITERSPRPDKVDRPPAQRLKRGAHDRHRD
jgi:DNA-binding transcriptional ArsR family regulator